MLIAVEGCCHGELDKIYETLAYIEKEHGKNVDLLLCCGDFQSVRNIYDLSCLSAPANYLRMQTFYKYYSGEKIAPVPTIFIGGNHEASNYLQELAYGGWVATNIYYLGNAGVINFGGLRIAGVSGIYKGHDYMRGHYEVPPYDEGTKRSVYHVRDLEIFRLKQISRPLDIFLSHDWPVGVTDFGNKNVLIRFKPFFQEDIEKGQLGNPATWDVLKKLQPKYWFSGHLHAKFSASVPHEGGARTDFLALDKCVPGKRFLQILDIPHDSNVSLEIRLDPEWCGILKDTDHLWSFDRTVTYMPSPMGQEKYVYRQSDEKLTAVKAALGDDLTVDPGEFQRVAPIHESEFGEGLLRHIVEQMARKSFPNPPVKNYINPQTTALCQKLGLTDPLEALMQKHAPKKGSVTSVFNTADPVTDSLPSGFEILSGKDGNPEEITLDDVGNDGDFEGAVYVVSDTLPDSSFEEPAPKKLRSDNIPAEKSES